MFNNLLCIQQHPTINIDKQMICWYYRERHLIYTLSQATKIQKKRSFHDAKHHLARLYARGRLWSLYQKSTNEMADHTLVLNQPRILKSLKQLKCYETPKIWNTIFQL